MCSPRGPEHSEEHAAGSLSGISAAASVVGSHAVEAVEAAGGRMYPCIGVAHGRAEWALGSGIRDWARMEVLRPRQELKMQSVLFRVQYVLHGLP